MIKRRTTTYIGTTVYHKSWHKDFSVRAEIRLTHFAITSRHNIDTQKKIKDGWSSKRNYTILQKSIDLNFAEISPLKSATPLNVQVARLFEIVIVTTINTLTTLKSRSQATAETWKCLFFPGGAFVSTVWRWISTWNHSGRDSFTFRQNLIVDGCTRVQTLSLSTSNEPR